MRTESLEAARNLRSAFRHQLQNNWMIIANSSSPPHISTAYAPIPAPTERAGAKPKLTGGSRHQGWRQSKPVQLGPATETEGTIEPRGWASKLGTINYFHGRWNGMHMGETGPVRKQRGRDGHRLRNQSQTCLLSRFLGLPRGGTHNTRG